MTYEERLKRLKAAAEAVRLGTMTAEQAAEALFDELGPRDALALYVDAELEHGAPPPPDTATADDPPCRVMTDDDLLRFLGLR
jgi:hypothetical protein